MSCQIHPGATSPCTTACTADLLKRAIDPDDRAVVEAAAILAAGHGVRFVVTIKNGLMADVQAVRLGYDHVGRVIR